MVLAIIREDNCWTSLSWLYRKGCNTISVITSLAVGLIFFFISFLLTYVSGIFLVFRLLAFWDSHGYNHRW